MPIGFWVESYRGRDRIVHIKAENADRALALVRLSNAEMYDYSRPNSLKPMCDRYNIAQAIGAVL